MQNFQLEELREMRNNLLIACGYLQKARELFEKAGAEAFDADEVDAWETNVESFLRRVIGKQTRE